MYKVGDKVVPHSKSVGCSLENSYHWEQANMNKQEFLYITGNRGKHEFWCSNKEDIDSGGDVFYLSDLTLYIEEKSQENVKIHDINGSKVSQYKVKDILHMVNMGILKEEDDIIFGRK